MASSSGDAHSAALRGPPTRSALSEEVLELLKGRLNEIMVQAHQPSTVERVPLDKKRKIEAKPKSFSGALHSFERAYTKLLHEACEGGLSPEMSASVRNLADDIKWKLHANCPDAETAGSQLLEEFLEHSQNEFKWQKMITVLEEALGIARREKSNVYNKFRLGRTALQSVRNQSP